MADKRLNVVLMLADQLRADSVGCYGNPIVQTPHLDRLAQEGTRFAWPMAQHPQCVPSRATILTGRYPHEHGATSNYTAMAENERTLGEYFREAGYRSIGVGKLHLFAQKEQAGFSKTLLCGGQHSGATSPECLHPDYKQWLKEHGYWEDAVRAYAMHADPSYWESFQAVVNPMPVEAYIDSWVGDQSAALIRQQSVDEPFFLFVGFPNPHVPFDPPEPYASMYKPEEMPLPATFPGDLSNKPPHQLAYKRHGRKMNYEKLDAASLQRVIAYYYAQISLVDAQVAKIMAALDERGLSENTLVLFVSDHGELLGHHGMLIKSIDEYPMLYDKLLHVPLLIRLPGAPARQVVEQPIELVDLAPTLLEAAGLPVAPEMQGVSLMPALHGGPAPQRDFLFAESGAVKALRDEHYKLVYYPGQPYGELYDIQADPLEVQNLYDDPTYTVIREGLMQALLDRLIYMEAPRHGESLRGPAYWRRQYRAPFELKHNSVS